MIYYIHSISTGPQPVDPKEKPSKRQAYILLDYLYYI